MFERIKVTQINDYIWLMNDNDEATGYLVTGEKKALVIDTMNGLEDVKAVVRTLTDLPVTVVNTHGHPDHIYGNVYFGEAYIHPADMELARQYYEDESFLKTARALGVNVGAEPAVLKPVYPGECFDLGGVSLEVIGIPGHTPGGIALLDRKSRILFSGDSILEQTWMQMPECLPMQDFLKSLYDLEKYRDAFDWLLTGHGKALEDAALYEVHCKAVEEVCQGINEMDEPYEWFGGVHRAHPYGPEPRRICYDVDRLKLSM